MSENRKKIKYGNRRDRDLQTYPFLAKTTIRFIFSKIFMNENVFQAKLIKEIKTRFPGCIVLKNDALYIQGFPDLLILYKNKWAALEVKKNAYASHRPNQDYYVSKLNEMSFAYFIFPENKEAVLDEMGRLFETD